MTCFKRRSLLPSGILHHSSRAAFVSGTARPSRGWSLRRSRRPTRRSGSVARWTLAQLALQRAPVHRKRPRACRNIAVILAQHLADVFPFCSMYRHRLFANGDAVVAAIALKRRDYLVGAGGLGQIVSRAKLDRLDRRSYARIAGQDHDAHVKVEREERREK